MSNQLANVENYTALQVHKHQFLHYQQKLDHHAASSNIKERATTHFLPHHLTGFDLLDGA